MFIIIFFICDRLFHNFILVFVMDGFVSSLIYVLWQKKTVKQGDMQKIRDIEKDLSYVCLQGRCSANMP